MKRRTQRRQGTKIGPGHVCQLRFGTNYLKGLPDFGDDLDAARAAWPRLREKLMTAHDPHGKNPGRRPWAYWKFDVGLDVPLGRPAAQSVVALIGVTELEYLQANDLLTERERVALA